MKRILILVALSLSTIAISSAQTKTLKVFILAGQSNMEGHGKIEMGRNPKWVEGVEGEPREIKGGIGSLRHMVSDPSTAATYKHLVNPDGTWATREDVFVYTTTSGTPKGKLSVGFGKNKWFGPELGFGHMVGHHLREPVLIIKCAWGGKDLAVDFRPPSSGTTDIDKGKREPGVYYQKMLEFVRDSLTSVENDFPELKGYKPQFAGFGWHQGFNDGLRDETVAEYEQNLANFIRDVRKELGVSNLPFVIANTGVDGPETKGRFADLCQAQLNLGDPQKHPELAGTVTVIDTRPFKAPEERAPSKFGYHWNHSAESHYKVGHAMGQAMMLLLNRISR